MKLDEASTREYTVEEMDEMPEFVQASNDAGEKLYLAYNPTVMTTLMRHERADDTVFCVNFWHRPVSWPYFVIGITQGQWEREVVRGELVEAHDLTVRAELGEWVIETFGDVLSTYTRAQAIEDGILVDGNVGDLGEVTVQHYKYPVAMTASVYGIMERAVANEKYMNDLKGVWHDILWMSRVNSRQISPYERHFIVIITGAGRQRNWEFKIVAGAGDSGEPVYTIMLPWED